ncbi:MAG: T9SS type A sorting domain-containing protein [Bacteroidota bacterium]
MKKSTFLALLLGALVFGSSIIGIAQMRPAQLKGSKKAVLTPVIAPSKIEDGIGVKPANQFVLKDAPLDDPITMITKYDLQSNKSTQNHLYLFPDGSLGSTAIWSQDPGGSWPARGTGYNYSSNGTTWGAMPSVRIENEKCGWPSYAPLGPTGEIVVTHTNTAGLDVARRTTKGTGAWTNTILAGPAGAVDISWPRMVTNGPNHTYVHVIALTYSAYQGLDLALLYYRSLDGGATWETKHRIIEGLTSSEYLGFSGDTYSWAEPHGDTLAFTVGDSWYDQILMKSVDNGTTWTKTVIYHSPYNLLGVGGSSPNFFYCPDGTCSVTLDNNNKAHVTFGLSCDSIFGSTSYYRLFWTNGIAYWNESMPALRDDLDPDSLYANNQLIGWVTDTMVFQQPTTAIADYYCSLTSNTTMTVDNNNNLFVVWSAPTTLLDPSGFMLRHIFERTASIYTGTTVEWNDNINDLTGNFLYNFTECQYPSVAAKTAADRIYVQFQGDDLAGGYVKGINVPGYAGQTSISDNNQIILNPFKNSIGVGIAPKKEALPALTVNGNFPNPVHGTTTIFVGTEKSGTLSVRITNMVGQTVLEMDKGKVAAGAYRLPVNCDNMQPGIYFYTVRLDNESITRKMVIE